jgi:hypothetical protein
MTQLNSQPPTKKLIEKASYRELLESYEECEELWGKYSCDCLGFYMTALGNRIIELGGWPPRTN